MGILHTLQLYSLTCTITLHIGSTQLPTSLCFRRHSTKKGNKDHKHLNRLEGSISEMYPSYNFPVHESSVRRYTANPSFAFMNPRTNQDIHDFYMKDRSPASPDRYSS